MGLAIMPEMSAEMAELSPQRPPIYDHLTEEDGCLEDTILGEQIQIISDLPGEELPSCPVSECPAIQPDHETHVNETGDEKIDLSGEDLGDFPVYGEMTETDKRVDPPAAAPDHVSDLCSYESLSKLRVREHEKRPDEMLRPAVRQTLQEMENSPQEHSPEAVKADEAFLRNIEHS
jgi:hypothetical protein